MLPVHTLTRPVRVFLACFAAMLGALSCASAPISWQAAVEARRAERPDILTAEDAAGGNNGVINGGWEFHTAQDASPWWQVDLETDAIVSRVVIHVFHIPERLNGFQIRVSDDGRHWRVVHSHGEVPAKTPLDIRFEPQKTRYVRVQVPSPTWMHLAEVQVFGPEKPETNLALNHPADQSSVSQWSTRSVSLKNDREGWQDDIAAGRAVIESIAPLAGPHTPDLLERTAQLVASKTRLDAPAWEKLYRDALEYRAVWSDTLTQWPLVDFDALSRALEDLSRRFPERYPQSERNRAEIERARAGADAISAGMGRHEVEAFERAKRIVALQREILLANPLLDFDRLLLVRRRLGPAARSAMGGELGIGAANHTSNDATRRTGWDNEIAVLTGLRTSPTVSALYKPEGTRIVSDLDLAFDGSRILFSSVGALQRNWRLFEIGVDGSRLTQVSPDDGADVGHFDACYLPDGDIIFASTATYQGLPCVYGSSQMVSLYRLYRATGRIRQLTFEQDSDWCPTVLNDGRVMYLRWEYTDLPHSNSRILFSMNPDGTLQREYYGTGSYFTPSFFDARPVPGHPRQVVGIATGHHGIARSGRLLLIDPAFGHREAEGVVQEFPGWGKTVEPIVRDRLIDGVWPQFTQPWPLSSDYHLVAMKPDAGSLWGIYLVDAFDNMTLIYQEEDAAVLEPIPLVARPVPPVIPDAVQPERRDATVFVADLYAGGGLDGIPKGAVKRLRVGTYYFSSRGTGGLLGSIGMDGPWDIKRVLGTVPVDADGSAFFRIPANTPIFVQPLDDEGKALQIMRSWFVGMPGETVSCVGCHESRATVVQAVGQRAARSVPDEIEPWHAPVHGFSFPDDVQPVLDRFCIACHDGSPRTDGLALPDLKTRDYITDWSSQISGNCGPSQGGNFSVSYANLHRYVRRPGIESDLRMLSPGEFHADTTELVQMLRDGRHHNVRLDEDGWASIVTWIDLNAPFHGTWADVAPVAAAAVAKANPRRRELSKLYAGIDVDFEAKPYRAPETPPEPMIPPPAVPVPDPPTCEGWPFSPEEAALRQGPANEATMSIDLGDGVSMTLKRIPAGRFVTGGNSPRVVTVDRPFWMSACEVSNAQFRRFDPDHDSRHESRHGYQFGRVGYPMDAPDLPAVRLNWNQAKAFCDWLGRRTGRSFALPTEDQWEYACRAGADTDYWFGCTGDDYTAKANLGDLRLKEFAACTAQGNYTMAAVIANPNRYDDWVPHDTLFDDGTFLTAEVGKYAPNPWGLCDMHGNVWEWTDSERTPGRKVVRGGSWYDRPQRCTASSWLDYRPYHRVFNVGFRVVCAD